MSADACPQMIIERGGWHSHPCGKPVKRDGLCGIHVAAKERVERNDHDRRERRGAAQAVVDRLVAHGVAAYADYDGRAAIAMNAEALADLLDALAGDQS